MIVNTAIFLLCVLSGMLLAGDWIREHRNFIDRVQQRRSMRNPTYARGRAELELMSNPTITKYDFVDGAEVNRRAANPLIGMRKAFEQIAKAANGIHVDFARSIMKVSRG